MGIASQSGLRNDRQYTSRSQESGAGTRNKELEQDPGANSQSKN